MPNLLNCVRKEVCKGIGEGEGAMDVVLFVVEGGGVGGEENFIFFSCLQLSIH